MIEMGWNDDVTGNMSTSLKVVMSSSPRVGSVVASVFTALILTSIVRVCVSASGGSSGGSAGGSSGSSTVTSTRIVRTKYGEVSGIVVSLDNRYLDSVEVFRGIPYASPPVGNLRFMPPVTGALWSGVKVAEKFSPVCPQDLPNIANETEALKTMPKGRLDYLKRILPHLQNQSEDCLYLNIYAPTQGMFFFTIFVIFYTEQNSS